MYLLYMGISTAYAHSQHAACYVLYRDCFSARVLVQQVRFMLADNSSRSCGQANNVLVTNTEHGDRQSMTYIRYSCQSQGAEANCCRTHTATFLGKTS